MIERDGDRLRVRGSITLADVTRWRAEGLALIDRDGLVVDLAGVEEADTSALSLLLEWHREARARGYHVRYENMPENMTSLANVYGVQELIPLVGAAPAPAR